MKKVLTVALMLMVGMVAKSQVTIGYGEAFTVKTENDVTIAIQGDHLGCGRAYIDSESQSLYIHSFKHI